MKSLIVVYLILFTFVANGQKESVKFPIDDATGKITYTEVVTVKDSVSKNELFSRAKICFVHLFNNSKNVIQNEDKEAGSLIGKGNITVHARALGTNYEGGYVNFTLTIAIKDGKYKYTVTDLAHEGINSMPSGGNLESGKPKQWMQRQWDGVLNETDSKIKDLISSVKLEMNKPSPKSDNW